MKKVIAILLLISTPNAFADWRMERFDLNEDGFIEKREISLSGCSIKRGLFKAADKNADGMLTKGEAKKATSYLFNRRRCPEMSDIRG